MSYPGGYPQQPGPPGGWQQPPPGGYPGQPAPGGYPGQPAPGGYPGYGQPPVDPLWGYFSAVAGQDGQIDANELQRCLSSSGISGSYQPFSKETCRIMIAMLDRDRSGKMGFNEFKELWAALNQWKTTFQRFDTDQSGTVETHEFQQAVTAFGYNLQPNTIAVLVRRFSNDGRIGFDDFVSCCIKLRALTAHFQARDTMRNGSATFRFDDFLQVAMGL
ncbi:PREDICTED: sorcin-like [Amphimedon queenslandica]|uniref:EF-hand domain-containing protein n=1 Tax=Amphimedon queenslandica TaxID=400682 RepID=A0A1X7VRZ4_AMPQE|nr:PREDICTED: sorcin-like [Amphimedon queenslandica]|eukprot:XP_003383149.1 PREDICTED: sorcin-like [Amphimedon queenslandica]